LKQEHTCIKDLIAHPPKLETLANGAEDVMKDACPGAYITGIGLVTPIGVGKKKFWSSMLANESGVGPITLFDSEGFDVKIAAECSTFEPEDFVDRKTAQRMDRFAQFALASTLMALDDARAGEFLGRHPARVGLVIGTGVGGMASRDRAQWEMDNKGVNQVNPFTVIKVLQNEGAAQIAIQLGIRGPSIAPALACACGTDAMGMGYELLCRGDADMVFCGASEATITPIGVAGLTAMRAMSTRNDDPQGACRPYDKDHSGLVIGEGAAVMVLETEESVRRRGVVPYAKITGIGRTTDAYNLADPDPEGQGITRAMVLAIKSAGLQPEQIGYINPHGTGTVAGDGPESWAIHSINPRVRLSATKSNLGHSMAATGAIEAAICALALKEQTIPPMRNLETLAKYCAPLEYVVGSPLSAPELEAAICANMGMGGHNVAITLERL
jgi:3-oxoacyl-[acyl-carrier-protein] synthase II